MKKILLSATLVASLFASDENFIELGAGYAKIKDNFNTESSSKVTALKSAKAENEVIPVINFNYTKKINEKIKIYAEGNESLKLGSKYTLDNNSSIDFGISGGISKEWKNPFLVNANKQKTDVVTLGAYTSYAFDLTPSIHSEIAYTFLNHSYDNESVANDLKREGKSHEIDFTNVFNLNLASHPVDLISNLNYTLYDAKGKASSYKEYGLNLGFSTPVVNDTTLTVIASYAKKDYDSVNTIFNKTVDSKSFGFDSQIKVEEPFSFKNTYLALNAGYAKEDANVNFYDKEQAYSTLSVGYKF